MLAEGGRGWSKGGGGGSAVAVELSIDGARVVSFRAKRRSRRLAPMKVNEVEVKFNQAGDGAAGASMAADGGWPAPAPTTPPIATNQRRRKATF